MSVSKTLSLFSLTLLVTAAEAQPPRPLSLPAPHPRPIGLPAPRPPVVGMPIRPPVGPRPPIVGMPIRPPVVGLPIHPPVVGMPIMPGLQSYELDCHASHGSISGIRRVKLDLVRRSASSFNVKGYVRFLRGQEVPVRTQAVGNLFRGNVDLRLRGVGEISLRPVGHGHRNDLQGNISLFGRIDSYGMNCELDRE